MRNREELKLFAVRVESYVFPRTEPEEIVETHAAGLDTGDCLRGFDIPTKKSYVDRIVLTVREVGPVFRGEDVYKISLKKE